MLLKDEGKRVQSQMARASDFKFNEYLGSLDSERQRQKYKVKSPEQWAQPEPIDPQSRSNNELVMKFTEQEGTQIRLDTVSELQSTAQQFDKTIKQKRNSAQLYQHSAQSSLARQIPNVTAAAEVQRTIEPHLFERNKHVEQSSPKPLLKQKPKTPEQIKETRQESRE